MKPLAGLLVAAAIAGCAKDGRSWRVGSDVPPNTRLTAGRPLEATACDYRLWPFWMRMDRIGRAHADLVEQARGDYIVDVTIEDVLIPLEFLGSIDCTRLTARAAKTVAPAVPVVAVAAPVFVAGQQARLRPGMSLRPRPVPDDTAIAGIGPAAALTLKAMIRKETGVWWYVTSPTGSGWVREAELEPVLP